MFLFWLGVIFTLIVLGSVSGIIGLYKSFKNKREIEYIYSHIDNVRKDIQTTTDELYRLVRKETQL